MNITGDTTRLTSDNYELLQLMLSEAIDGVAEDLDRSELSHHGAVALSNMFRRLHNVKKQLALNEMLLDEEVTQ